MNDVIINNSNVYLSGTGSNVFNVATASLAKTASLAIKALTASFIINPPGYVLSSKSASYSLTSSYALKSGFSLNSVNSTYSINALSASWAPNSGGSTIIVTSSDYLNVVEYGKAIGDARITTANTIISSSIVIIADTVTSKDIGKTIEIFSGETDVDYIGIITGISGSNIVIVQQISKSEILKPRGNIMPWSITNARCIIGTDNTPMFQKTIDDAAALGKNVYIPDGTYLLIPSQWEMYTKIITMPDASIKIVGHSQKNTILLGNGAWQLTANEWKCQRGVLFAFWGPFNKANTVTFENFTMNGGVECGYLRGSNPINGFPGNGWQADANTGYGWDMTHAAVLWAGTPPSIPSSIFKNITVIKYRGEAIKGTVPNYDATALVEDCDFVDINASAWNSPWITTINRCKFSDCRMVTEFYQAYGVGRSKFTNNFISGSLYGTGGEKHIVIVGADIHNNVTSVLIDGNYIIGGEFAIFLAGAKNISITNNIFSGQVSTIGNGYGQYGVQGNDYNRNWIISNNIFDGVFYGLSLNGTAVNRVERVSITDNIYTGIGGSSIFLYGYQGEMIDVTYQGNFISNGSVRNDGNFIDLGNYCQPEVESIDVTTPINTINYTNSQDRDINIWRVSGSMEDIQFKLNVINIPPYSKIKIRAVGEWPMRFLSSTTQHLNAPMRVLHKYDTLELKYSDNMWYEVNYSPSTQVNVSSIPTNVFYYKGEILNNTNPLANTPMTRSWICTVSGNPATFTPY